MTGLDEAIREAWKFCYDTYPDGKGDARHPDESHPEIEEEVKSEEIMLDIKERIMKAYWDGYYKGFRDGQDTGE